MTKIVETALDTRLSLRGFPGPLSTGQLAEFGGSTACYLGCGTMFKLAPPAGGGGWTETILRDLGNSGQNRNSSIVEFHDGLVYGTPTFLGASDLGQVFTLAP